MNVKTFGAFWDIDNNTGFVQIRGTTGSVLPNGNIQFTDPAKFCAVLTILESAGTAVWDAQAKRIRTGEEVVQE